MSIARGRSITSLGTLYFVANDGTHGYELWRSDGTGAGTTMVKDIRPGPGGSLGQFGENGVTDIAGTLFFWANDGIHGNELWKSDGTQAGTVLVDDIRPGLPGLPLLLSTTCRARFALYFRANDGTHGQEPWMSDGTAGGTVMWRTSGTGLVNEVPSCSRSMTWLFLVGQR